MTPVATPGEKLKDLIRGYRAEQRQRNSLQPALDSARAALEKTNKDFEDAKQAVVDLRSLQNKRNLEFANLLDREAESQGRMSTIGQKIQAMGGTVPTGPGEMSAPAESDDK